jgi:hypothetical protein
VFSLRKEIQMSTELRKMKRTGSRNVELSVLRFSGGKNGMCIQLTGEMEEGGYGYVQLNKKDMVRLIKTWEKEVGALGNKETCPASHNSRVTARKPRPKSARRTS